MDHERCSELLLPYTKGQLDAPGVAELEAHLASCRDCAAELTTLEGIAATDPDPMGELERLRLRRAVLAAAPLSAERLETRGAPQSRWAARLAPSLAAAAVLVVIATGIVWLGQGGGDDGGGSGAGGAAEDAGGATGRLESEPVPGVEKGPPQPVFESGSGARTMDDLAAVARTRGAFAGYAESYVADDAAELGEPLLRRLQKAAPAAMRDQIGRCGEQVLANERAFLLPAYGARTRIEGRLALVLGFAWTRTSGRLDRYQLWAWPEGKCALPLGYLSGPIRYRPAGGP